MRWSVFCYLLNRPHQFRPNLQTCSRCNAISSDTSLECVNCKADLKVLSQNAVARKRMAENPRVSTIRINVAGDACPLCYESRGTFSKDAVPRLPHEGCSHAKGCRCTYEPVLNDIYP
jgi:hypothetical protein